MKFIDKNGKLFSKISIIDIIIIVTLLFLAAVFALNLFGKADAPVSNVPEVSYTTELKVYSMYKTAVEPFAVGDNVYSSTGALIGKIEEIAVEDAYTKKTMANGQYVDFKSGEYVDYYLKISGKGSQTDAGIKSGGVFALNPNAAIIVSSRLYYGNAIVLSVKKSA